MAGVENWREAVHEMAKDRLEAGAAGAAVQNRIHVGVAPEGKAIFPHLLMQTLSGVTHNALGGKRIRLRCIFQCVVVTREDRRSAALIQPLIDQAINGMKGPENEWNAYVDGCLQLGEVDDTRVQQGARYTTLGYKYLVYVSAPLP